MKSIFAPGLFAGEIALVTGGGTGIGLATARELGSLGAKLVIASRKAENVEAGRKALEAAGIEVLALTCDIREPEQVQVLVERALDRYGRIDILVNNAGGQFPSPVETMSTRGFDAVIRNNLNGTFYVTHAVATRAMLPRGRGRIVNVIANIERGFPGMAHTGAARAGVENLTRSLAIEWASRGVRVNAVAPGSNIKSSGTAQYGDEMLEAARRATPLKRLGSPEEVARLIVFLSSFANDYITGATYYIDGGQRLWGDVWPIEDAAK